MTELKDKYELFDILKGPYPMKFLCTKYNEYKGQECFSKFFDNGDCGDDEIDLIYHGTIRHFCDGDFYSISCCVRDPYDIEEDINPAVRFSLEFVQGSPYTKFFEKCPMLEDVSEYYSIRSVPHFIETLNKWEVFVKKSIKLIEKNRKDWLAQLSPAPDTKELYDFVGDDLRHHVKSSADSIINFKGL